MDFRNMKRDGIDYLPVGLSCPGVSIKYNKPKSRADYLRDIEQLKIDEKKYSEMLCHEIELTQLYIERLQVDCKHLNVDQTTSWVNGMILIHSRCQYCGKEL